MSLYRRTDQICVTVKSADYDAAVQHYAAIFQLEPEPLDENATAFRGANFTLRVDRGEPKPSSSQEFETATLEAARELIEASHARIVGASSEGFYVQDPYGLHFHVRVGQDRTDAPQRAVIMESEVNV